MSRLNFSITFEFLSQIHIFRIRLFLRANENSQNMAVAKRTLEFTDHAVPFQAAFIAGGYSTVDSIVNGAMLVWKSNKLQYDNNILAAAAIYGNVGVYEEGGIYYITFLASNFP